MTREDRLKVVVGVTLILSLVGLELFALPRRPPVHAAPLSSSAAPGDTIQAIDLVDAFQHHGDAAIRSYGDRTVIHVAGRVGRVLTATGTTAVELEGTTHFNAVHAELNDSSWARSAGLRPKQAVRVSCEHPRAHQVDLVVVLQRCDIVGDVD